MRNLRIAFSLLTTIPVGLPEDWKTGDSGRAAVWYPLVGLVIGGLVWLAWRMSHLYFPPQVTGVLSLLVWILLTGGLHLDGLVDCCDGLFSSAAPERRLEIMKDPRLGTFGAVGLLMVLLLKATVLGSLSFASSPAVILAAVLGRWCILPAGLMPLARSGGMGADFSAGLRRASILVAGVLPFGLAALLGTPGFLAALTALVAMAVVLCLAKARINGVTGDVFGMLVEVTETVVLLVFMGVAQSASSL